MQVPQQKPLKTKSFEKLWIERVAARVQFADMKIQIASVLLRDALKAPQGGNLENIRLAHVAILEAQKNLRSMLVSAKDSEEPSH